MLKVQACRQDFAKSHTNHEACAIMYTKVTVIRYVRMLLHFCSFKMVQI